MRHYAMLRGVLLGIPKLQKHATAGDTSRMRWKLLLVASLFAAIIGAGAMLGIVLVLGSSVSRPPMLDVTTSPTLFISIVAIVVASIFVYRHTARRRLLQAVLTMVFAALLTLASLFACWEYLTSR